MNLQIKTIRIFISSTFKDMHSERDYLVKYVFPELRERCIKKGLSLVDVDLRWGVTEEEAEQGKAIEICLDEIENCKPFFIGILGERYGWTPTTYQVPDYEKYDWLRKFEKGHSITALEIYHGVLNKKEMKPRAFFYFRDPGFISDVPGSKQHEVKAESDISAKKLLHLKADINDTFTAFDMPGHVMENYPCSFKGLKINLQLVKDSFGSELTVEEIDMLEKVTGGDNLIENNEYELLNGQQKSIVDKHSYVYLEGLETFGDEVLKNVWEAICDEHPDENIVTDPLLIEQAYHQRFMNSRTRMFIGREDVLGEIGGYLNDATNRKPLMVIGEPGSGKSALMAVAAQQNENKSDAGFTIVRFVGASPASLDINKLVQNIIRETASHFEITVDEERINDVKVLYEYFREVLFSASSKGRLTIFIDAVNQLLPQFDPHHLVWLPKFLPENVKIAISAIESEHTKNAVKYDLPFVNVGVLAPVNCNEIVHDTLYEYRKELNPKQMELLLSKADAVKPLYLKVACEELRVFASFELISSRIARLPETIAELFEQFFERLEADHDPKLVKDTLCLIESSMYGLLESELLELLKPEDKEKLPVNIWAKLYRNLSPYLMDAGDEKEGLLEFFHLQLSSAVQTRYLAKDAISYNKRLADYGLLKYYLDTANTLNTVSFTGIYLYKSLEENTLYELLKAIFSADNQNYRFNETIAANVFDWVMNNCDFETETILKSVSDKLAINTFSDDYGAFLNNKGIILKDTGKISWVLDFCKKSLKVMEALILLNPSKLNVRKDYAANLNNLGQIYQLIGETNKAMEFFEKVQTQMIEWISSEFDDFRRELVVNLGSLGRMYQILGNGQKALELFEKQKNIMEELIIMEPDRSDLKRELAVCFSNLGSISKELGNGRKALEFFEINSQIMAELLVNEPTRTDLRKEYAAYSLCNLGQMHEFMGEEQKALEIFEESLVEMQELIALEPERTDFKNGYAISLANIGRVYFTIGEMTKTFEFLEKSMKIKEELVDMEPYRTDFRRELSVTLNNLGSAYQAIKDGFKALQFYEKSVCEMEKLIALEPSRSDYRNDLSECFSSVGQIYYEMGENIQSLEFFEKSLNELEKLILIEPSRTQFKENYILMLGTLGQIFKELEEGKKSIEFFEKQKNTLNELVTLAPEKCEFRRELSVSLMTMGKFYQARGDGKKAIVFFEESAKELEKIVSIHPNRSDFMIDYALILSLLGKMYQFLEENQKALICFEKDLKVLIDLVSLEPNRTDFKRELSVCYNTLGQLHDSIREKDIAMEFFKKDLHILDELVSNEPNNFNFKIDYAWCLWDIYLTSQKDEKYGWLNKIIGILTPLVQNGIREARLMILLEYVMNDFNHYSSKNINKREEAISLYLNGDYKAAKELFQELLNDNFEILSTCMHLARLTLITDNLEEVALHTYKVWEMRKEAKNYVVARILWFKIALTFLCKSSFENFLGQLKAILQKEDAFMDWTMQPVLDHIKPQLTEYQYAFLSALVAALSDKANLDKLNEFAEWRNAKPEEMN